MKQLQVREKQVVDPATQIEIKPAGMWEPFADDNSGYFDPQKMMDGIAKNYPNMESRTVDMAQLVLPEEVKDKIARITRDFDPKPEITHVSHKGVLVRFKIKRDNGNEQLWANVISWDGNLMGSGDYRLTETIFIYDYFIYRL